MKSVTLQLPDEIAELLTADAREARLSQTLALVLVLQGKLGAGKAAELLGMHLTEFVQLMEQHGIPYYHYAPDDWEAEEQTLHELMAR
ncbi:MAG: UPF0175 family protein [Fimbriimonadales bacterium]|nr:UPF0175 family protein [Fimbriimonadales bacterium]